MKPVRFSQHAIVKLEVLKAHGVKIDEELIRSTVTYPERVRQGYRGRQIAERAVAPDHIVRVVYEERPQEIFVITFYPARRGRYDSDKV